MAVERDSQDALLVMGRIVAPYGVKGWVRVVTFTETAENLLAYSPWYLMLNGHWQEAEVQEGKLHGKGLVVRLAGCEDRDAAAGFSGKDIGVYRSQLPTPEADEYYWSDLIGLTVINQENIILGQIEYLLETGANDVMVVTGKGERLIPLVFKEIVLEVNLAQRWLRVAWDVDF